MAWSACSKSCGGGKQIRSRVCKQPKHGGMTCIGGASEERDCRTQPCPSKILVALEIKLTLVLFFFGISSRYEIVVDHGRNKK
jgi:hypothetical protein